MPQELTNDLRLRILENKEILGKSQIWVKTFGHSSQETRKSGYQTFLVLSSFTGFLYFVPNILSRIVECEPTSHELRVYPIASCELMN